MPEPTLSASNSPVVAVWCACLGVVVVVLLWCGACFDVVVVVLL